jgi:hypothetical protein
VNSLSLFHQILRDLLVGSEVATVSSEKPEKPMRRIATDQKVGHSLVIVKILTAQRTLELHPQDATLFVMGSLLEPLTLDSLKEGSYEWDQTPIIQTAEEDQVNVE